MFYKCETIMTVKYYFSNVNDGDLSRNRENGIKNRERVLQKLWIDFQNATFLHQEHSDWVVFIDELLQNQRNENVWDAIITKKYNRIISVRIADCVPIALYDDINWIIAVAHAWWKWTSKMIVKKVLKQMLEIWANITNIHAIIWPAISQENYEVWADVADLFHDEVKILKSDWKYLLNLKQENKNQLLSLWIKDEHIVVSDIDTFIDGNYFSARKWNKWNFWLFLWQE